MGKDCNRKSLKMRQRRGQSKKKARARRRAAEVRAERAARR